MKKLLFSLFLALLACQPALGADTKLADLTATTTPLSTDILYIVVDPSGTPLNRKVTVGNLFGLASWNSSTQTFTIANITASTLLTATASSLGIASGTSLNLSGLTASRCLLTDGSKNLASATTDCPILGANTFTGAQTITAGTVVVSTPFINATQTWNDGAVTFTGIKANITSTASAAASLLMDLQIAGSTVFKVTKAGAVTGQGFIASLGGTSVDNNNNGLFLNRTNSSYINWHGDTTLFSPAAGTVDIGTSATGCGTAANCRDLKVRHIIASGAAPSLDTGCGTGTLATGSSDGSGKITTNATGACTIVMTFGVAYARAPACAVNNETTANLARAATTTTTATFSGTTVSGDVLSYHCFGY